MLGLWIDSLTDDDRDAILRHPDPTYGGDLYWDLDRECGCLVGTVLNARHPHVRPLRASLPEFEVERPCGELMELRDVGHRFPELTARFGARRVWRACKQRAAKGNRVDLGEPAEAEAVVPVLSGRADP